MKKMVYLIISKQEVRIFFIDLLKYNLILKKFFLTRLYYILGRKNSDVTGLNDDHNVN